MLAAEKLIKPSEFVRWYGGRLSARGATRWYDITNLKAHKVIPRQVRYQAGYRYEILVLMDFVIDLASQNVKLTSSTDADTIRGLLGGVDYCDFARFLADIGYCDDHKITGGPVFVARAFREKMDLQLFRASFAEFESETRAVHNQFGLPTL